MRYRKLGSVDLEVSEISPRSWLTRRTARALGVLLGVLALATCGGGGESQSGYFNMRTLAQVLEEHARQAGYSGTTVTCTRTGKQTAKCQAQTSGVEKHTTSVDVSISADGKTFVTH